MSDIVIQVENVSKLYQLGETGTGSFKKDLQRWWNISVMKRNDPFFQEPIEEEEEEQEDYSYNQHLSQAKNSLDNTASSSHIWALNQVSFKVKRGEVWGIIGANGSGKSTLLKIISRIILPTHGTVHGKGRVSSLLEVGAGFHDELTGRENVYLNGYVLGMKRHEIQKRFDEIVEFSGIGQFIDTPVKRYSSGMYVRLAFSVAAHLDADIMVLDEVLSVGDAQFQRKCIDKIQEFAQEDDRTILFVSHNSQAVANLCQQAIWLDHGRIKAIGQAQSILSQYSQFNITLGNQLQQAWNKSQDAPGNKLVRIKSLEVVPQLAGQIDVRTPLTIKFQLWILAKAIRLLIGLHLITTDGDVVFDIMSPFADYEKGIIEGECAIPGNLLNDGSYYIAMAIHGDNWEQLYYYRSGPTFTVEDYRSTGMEFEGKWGGIIRPTDLLSMRLNQVSSVITSQS